MGVALLIDRGPSVTLPLRPLLQDRSRGRPTALQDQVDLLLLCLFLPKVPGLAAELGQGDAQRPHVDGRTEANEFQQIFRGPIPYCGQRNVTIAMLAGRLVIQCLCYDMATTMPSDRMMATLGM